MKCSDWLPVVPNILLLQYWPVFLGSGRGFKAFAGRTSVAITAPYTSKMAAIASLNAVAPVSTPQGAIRRSARPFARSCRAHRAFSARPSGNEC